MHWRTINHCVRNTYRTHRHKADVLEDLSVIEKWNRDVGISGPSVKGGRLEMWHNWCFYCKCGFWCSTRGSLAAFRNHLDISDPQTFVGWLTPSFINVYCGATYLFWFQEVKRGGKGKQFVWMSAALTPSGPQIEGICLQSKRRNGQTHENNSKGEEWRGNLNLCQRCGGELHISVVWCLRSPS